MRKCFHLLVLTFFHFLIPQHVRIKQKSKAKRKKKSRVPRSTTMIQCHFPNAIYKRQQNNQNCAGCHRARIVTQHVTAFQTKIHLSPWYSLSRFQHVVSCFYDLDPEGGKNMILTSTKADTVTDARVLLRPRDASNSRTCAEAISHASLKTSWLSITRPADELYI